MGTEPEPGLTDDKIRENATSIRTQMAHLAEIRELNKRIIVARRDHLEAKDEASARKKDHDRLVDELSELIAREPDPQMQLFDDPVNDEPVVESDSGPVDDEPAPVDNDAWRDVPLTEALSLTAKQYERFADHGVKTVGQLEDLRAGEGILSIPRFGLAMVDKIENQIIDWLTENRDQFGEPTDEPEPEIADGDQAADDASDADNQDDDTNLEGMFAEDDLPETDDADDNESTDDDLPEFNFKSDDDQAVDDTAGDLAAI